VSAPGDPNLTRGAFDARAAAQAQSAPVIAKPSVELPMPPLRAETPVARPLLQADTVKVVEPVTPVYDETVFAVVYEAEFEGLPTANGELYTNTGMTAAHPDLPLPSLLHVVNEATGREIVVRVNDRGPFEDGAGLQLSARAADALGMSGAGRGKVSLRYLGPAPQLDKAAMPAPRSQPATSPRFEAPPMQKIAYEPRLPVADPEGYTGETRYAVQLAAFSDRANADVFYREVMGIMPATIEAAEVNGVTWHRVRVGPVDGRAAADDLRARLMAEGFDQARIVPAS
jgi:rare lipoprotein A